MRIIKPDTGHLIYERIFNSLITNQSPIVIWQTDINTNKREVSDARVSSFQSETNKLQLNREGANPLDKQLPLYFYVGEGQLIFKSSLWEVTEKDFTASVPTEIHLLEDLEIEELRISMGPDFPALQSKPFNLEELLESGIDDYIKIKSMAERSGRDREFLNQEFGVMSLDEEDKLYADKRESPRARPKDDKWVKVALGRDGAGELFKLFDLSRGGVGFLIYDERLFPKGCTIRVLGFDKHDLDYPLIGKVMSIREVDDTKVSFKVGVKFNEGQS